LAFRKAASEDRDQMVIELVLASQRDSAALGRTAQALDRVRVETRKQVMLAKLRQKISSLSSCKIVEERTPGVAISEPDLPVLLERILDLGRKVPKRHRSRSVEELLASRPRHFEHDTSLREAVGPRKAARKRNRAVPAEHPVCVPPAGAIHFAVSSDDQPELEEPVEVDCQ